MGGGGEETQELEAELLDPVARSIVFGLGSDMLADDDDVGETLLASL